MEEGAIDWSGDWVYSLSETGGKIRDPRNEHMKLMDRVFSQVSLYTSLDTRIASLIGDAMAICSEIRALQKLLPDSPEHVCPGCESLRLEKQARVEESGFSLL